MRSHRWICCLHSALTIWMIHGCRTGMKVSLQVQPRLVPTVTLAWQSAKSLAACLSARLPPRLASGDGVPALDHVAVELPGASPRVSPGASPRVSPGASPRDSPVARDSPGDSGNAGILVQEGEGLVSVFNQEFGSGDVNQLTVQTAVWNTMLRTSTRMDEKVAFKAVVKDTLRSSGIQVSTEPVVDGMIDELMENLVRVDKVDIKRLLMVVREIPEFMKIGVEVKDFPRTSTVELLKKVQNLSDLLHNMSKVAWEQPPDISAKRHQSAAECIKECFRMLRLLSQMRVGSGISWDSEELVTLVTFLQTINKRSLNVLPRMPLDQTSEFLKLALVTYINEDVFKKFATAVAHLTSWAKKNLQAQEEKVEKAEAAAEAAGKGVREKGRVGDKRSRDAREDVEIEIGSPSPEHFAALKGL